MSLPVVGIMTQKMGREPNWIWAAYLPYITTYVLQRLLFVRSVVNTYMIDFQMKELVHIFVHSNIQRESCDDVDKRKYRLNLSVGVNYVNQNWLFIYLNSGTLLRLSCGSLFVCLLLGKTPPIEETQLFKPYGFELYQLDPKGLNQLYGISLELCKDLES